MADVCAVNDVTLLFVGKNIVKYGEACAVASLPKVCSCFYVDKTTQNTHGMF